MMINIANERTTHSNLTMNTLFPQIHRNTRQGLHQATQQRQAPAKNVTNRHYQKRYQKTRGSIKYNKPNTVIFNIPRQLKRDEVKTPRRRAYRVYQFCQAQIPQNLHSSCCQDARSTCLKPRFSRGFQRRSRKNPTFKTTIHSR
jgi:hypothetical protein